MKTRTQMAERGAGRGEDDFLGPGVGVAGPGWKTVHGGEGLGGGRRWRTRMRAWKG